MRAVVKPVIFGQCVKGQSLLPYTNQRHHAPKTQLEVWLISSGSLTARLEQLSGSNLGVWVVSEGYRPLLVDEKVKLGVACGKAMMAWQRTVYLYDNRHDFHPLTAWVRATSVFPITSLIGNGKRLKQLKQTPIGYVLFKKNRTLPFCRTIYRSAFGQHPIRQTVYDWQGRKILITEEFLPTLVEILNKTHPIDT